VHNVRALGDTLNEVTLGKNSYSEVGDGLRLGVEDGDVCV
jgi:hypothetical protein